MFKRILCVVAVLMIVFITAIPCSAAGVSGYPDFPANNYDTENYLVVYESSTQKTFLFHFNDTPFELQYVYVQANGNRILRAVCKDFNNLKYDKYVLSDGAWHFVSNYKSAEMYHSLKLNDTTTMGENGFIVYSFSDVYNVDGTVFFPLPPLTLAEEVSMVVRQEMTQMTTQVGGVMTTITLCGVGLMALLMVFVLFGKPFRQFHQK